MFPNPQSTQNTAQPFGSQPNTGGFGLFNNQPQNSAFNNTAPQSGNIFGAQTQQSATPFGGQPAQGQGLFGGANQNSNANPGVPAFGTVNNAFGNNQTSQSAFGAFGQTQTSTAFGNNQNQSSLPAFGASNNAFGSAPAQGAGIFGSNQTQGQGTNLFSGNPQPQQTGGSIFGNTQQQQPPAFGNNSGTPFTGGSIFGGAGNNATNTGGNVFGSFGNNNNANNNLANKGVFGQASFGGGNNNTASPFGGANNTSSVFGAANTGTPFGNNQGPSIFGGTNNNGGFSFGNNNQQPQNNMFGANTSQPFGNSPATTNQQFGAFGQTTSTSIFNKSPTNSAFNNTPPKGQSILGGPSNQTFAFGNNTLNQQNQAFSSQPTNQNSFGNTTWGVPTNGAIAVGGAQLAKFSALKPKNAKIDGKHLVKCITLLDQNTSFCKNQLRIRHIMTGGQVPGQTVASGFGQPVGGGQAFFGNASNTNANTNSGLGFSFSKQPGNAFGQQQTSAFGQQQNNAFGQQQTNAFGQQQNNTFGQQNNAFGQQQAKSFGQQNNAFGTTSTLFGAQQGFQNVAQPVAGGSPTLFGGNSTIGTTGGSGLFGTNNAAQPTNAGFGIGLNNNPTTPTNTGLFAGGNNTAFKQTGNFFGGNTAPQTPAFGNTQQPSGGFSLGLGNQNQQQPVGGNLFGSNQATNQGGLFGGGTTGMFSGLSQPAQTSTQAPQGTQGSLFGGGLLSNNQPQTSSGLSFGFNAQPSTPTLFGQKTEAQPSPTLFGNQSTPNLSGMFSSTPTAQNFQNLASQGIFSSAPQAQSQAQAQAQALFGGQPGSTPAGTITQGSDLATILLNGLFNTEFFKKLVHIQNTPFDSLRMEAKKRNQEKKQDFFGQKITNSEDDLSVGYIPRYNKNHKAMYSSLLNFNQSPYMYNQIGNESNNEMKQTQKLRQRFNNKNQKFEPKILSERRPERPIVNERTSQVRPQPQPSPSRNQTQRKPKLIANESDIPKLDKKYKIEPSLQQLKQKTGEQLKRVPNVQIWNQHGKIAFKSPINLYRKVISDCVFIGENTIDINDVQWDDKKCQLYFYDFGGYSNLGSEEDKSKLEKKMRKWIKKNGMHEHSFDKGTGTLHVEIF